MNKNEPFIRAIKKSMFYETYFKRLNNAALLIRLITIFNFITLLNTYNCCLVIGIDQLEKSLCKSKACPNYSKCKIDENGFYAKCYCPYDCDLNDLNSMLLMFATAINRTYILNIRTDQTVCGTNGKDYRNFCELQREACNENYDIKIAYLGKCGKREQQLKINIKIIIIHIKNKRSMQ